MKRLVSGKLKSGHFEERIVMLIKQNVICLLLILIFVQGVLGEGVRLEDVAYNGGKDAKYGFTPEEIHDGERVKVKVVGRFVLPKDTLGQKFKLDRVKLNVVEYHPEIPFPYPVGYLDWSDEKQKAWSGTPVGKRLDEMYWEFVHARMALGMEAGITVEADWRFEYEVEWTGIYTWSYSTYVTAPKSGRLVLFQGWSSGHVKIKKGDKLIDLGAIELVVSRNQGVGNMLEDFEVPGLNGGVVRTKDYRGKFLLIDFWATWCGPCIAQTPYIKAAKAKYGDRLGVIMISADIKINSARAYVKEKGLEHFGQGFVGLDGAALEKGAAVLRRVPVGYPYIYLVGPDGKILTDSGLRKKGIEEALKKHVGEYDKLGYWNDRVRVKDDRDGK